jgi:hypothetical protein
MKFINYLTSITDVKIYPMAALMIFTLVFLIAVAMALFTKKSGIEEQKNIPLD